MKSYKCCVSVKSCHVVLSLQDLYTVHTCILFFQSFTAQVTYCNLSRKSDNHDNSVYQECTRVDSVTLTRRIVRTWTRKQFNL